MAFLELRAFIRAPQQAVWDVITDFPAQAGWMADVRRLEVTSEQRGGAGTIVEVTSELFGLPLVHDVMEVTHWQPPLQYRVAHRGAFSGSGLFRLEPAPGGTVFVWQEEFRPPLGPLGEIGFRLVVRDHLRRVFGRSLDNLARLCEARAARESGEASP